ncbi:MAG TPA: Rne/Rng family ribonuclease [Jatrophihabitantaceae bacterium]|nr:Rne/Rng family ribonuclease [Jatrophihabitantaceae bacterium]
MLESDTNNTDSNPTSSTIDGDSAAPATKAPRKRAAKKVAAPPDTPAKAGAKASTKASTAAKAAKKSTAKKAGKKTAAAPPADAEAPDASATAGRAAMAAPPSVLFQPPEAVPVAKAAKPTKQATKGAARPAKKAAAKATKQPEVAPKTDLTAVEDPADRTAEPDDIREAAIEEATGARRRRRRGRRGRGGGSGGGAAQQASDETVAEPAETDAEASDEGTEATDGTGGTDAGDAAGTSTHRRRRRRRSGANDVLGEDEPPNTITHVREPREVDDGVKGVKGSTRLEAKRQRRRDGRETNRRRPQILSEAEFLARRESVDRVMAVRQNGDRTQIAVLEDGILVEHYVTRASATSYVGNVYLGKVQNVLPSMEAAFIDIGKGRNGVLYAGEVNWDAAGLEGKSRAIEQALKSGDSVLVQVTKDPIGHKGARLTSQVSLPGRFLVYVPGGGMTGISRKLPDTERHRLKAILKKIVPEDAGVIIRTAAEGASEEDLTRDVERLKAQWESIQKKAQKTSSAPTLVHGEPDLAIRVVRDVFNEDFKRLVVEGDDAWRTVSEYVENVAPDLAERVSRHTAEVDLFHELHVDEGLAKALDRKVWLPSGGSLVIDRTEAMTVIDVNTGKFVGSGGNLEQTVTRNNLEAAEEIVRQLRLRDVGGIVVIDFIDMVLESNRELVLRRLTECLGRDRTKHQVAEVTSLGLVQMTRKRVGEGLLEAFSEPCEVCRGRGVIIHAEPISLPSAPAGDDDDRPKSGAKRKRGGAAKQAAPSELTPEEFAAAEEQRLARLAAITAIHRAAHPDEDEDGLLDEVEASADDDLADDLAVDLADEVSAVELAVELADDTITTVLDAEPSPDGSGEPAAVADEQVDEPVDEQVDEQGGTETPARAPAPRRRRAASRPAGPPVAAGTS